MSLQIWLPLNENFTTNNGLMEISPYTIENSLINYDNSILGHKGFVSGSNRILFDLEPELSGFSISIWVKENNTEEGEVLFSVDNFNCVKVSDGYQITNLASGTLFDLEDGWNNLIITADGSNVKCYVNGVLSGSYAQLDSISEYSTVIIGGSSNEDYWSGIISDFKLYNNALSLFEVINESKALVVNYGLNGIISTGHGITLPAETTLADWGFGDKEYDVSGNGFNATFGNVAPEYSNDTAVHSSSLDFTNSNPITSPTINTTEFANRYTASVWVKGTGTAITFSNGGSIFAEDADAWHNITITSSGKKYIDGVESPTVQTGLIGTGETTITIGSEYSGKISDFKLYAKELSESDILSMYTTKYNIDNSGNFYCAEFDNIHNEIIVDDITTDSSLSTVTDIIDPLVAQGYLQYNAAIYTLYSASAVDPGFYWDLYPDSTDRSNCVAATLRAKGNFGSRSTFGDYITYELNGDSMNRNITFSKEGYVIAAGSSLNIYGGSDTSSLLNCDECRLYHVNAGDTLIQSNMYTHYRGSCGSWLVFYTIEKSLKPMVLSKQKKFNFDINEVKFIDLESDFHEITTNSSYNEIKVQINDLLEKGAIDTPTTIKMQIHIDGTQGVYWGAGEGYTQVYYCTQAGTGVMLKRYFPHTFNNLVTVDIDKDGPSNVYFTFSKEVIFITGHQTRTSTHVNYNEFIGYNYWKLYRVAKDTQINIGDYADGQDVFVCYPLTHDTLYYIDQFFGTSFNNEIFKTNTAIEI